MKANNDKSHLLLSCNEPSTLATDGCSIETNTKKCFLEFDDHVNSLCKKACQKLNAFVRLASHMNVKKRRIIMKAFRVSIWIMSLSLDVP